jgi:hypothetical protein
MISLHQHGGGAPNAQPIYRQVAIYLLRRNTGIHLDILARRFRRSRTTIIRTIALVERKLAARSRAYTSAIDMIDVLLELDGLTVRCTACKKECTPGPICHQCNMSES